MATAEKAFADLFKANPGAKVDVIVKSIRFPSASMAIEEGLLRHTSGPKSLPHTTAYVAVHAKEDGAWRIALSSESPAGQNRLEDLEWLLGEWTGKVKDDAIKLSFHRDAKKPAIVGSVSGKKGGKDVSRSVRIALDPETGQLRSWGFEDDGGHSQALWVRDNKGWILDTRGVLADGTPVGERIIIQRVAPDAITWRSIDRVAGETRLPDLPPVRLTRAASSN